MSYWTKRKLMSAYRALLLVPTGGLCIWLGIVKDDGQLFLLICGIVALCIGIYCAYDFFIGTNKDRQSVDDARNKVIEEQKHIRESMRSNKDTSPIKKNADFAEHNVEEAVAEEESNTSIPVEDLKKLKELHEDGILSDDEFSDMKKKLLEL